MQAQPVETMNAAHGPHDLPPRVLAPVYRVGLFLLFMTVSFVVFAVGHSAWIPYEWRLAARAGLALAHDCVSAIMPETSSECRGAWKGEN